MYKYTGPNSHKTSPRPLLPTIPNPIKHLRQRRIRLTKVKIALLEIIPPIRRKRHRLPTGPLHRKRRHKDQQLCTSTNSRAQDIVILEEPLRVAAADVELDVEAETEGYHDGGVDADGQVAEIPGDDGRDDVVEAHFREGAVEEVEGEGNEETEREREHDPLVGAADAEEIA